MDKVAEKPDHLHKSCLVCVKHPNVEPEQKKSRKKQRREPVLITDTKHEPPEMMVPSAYLAELKQTSEERLANTHTMHLPKQMTRLEVDPYLISKTFHVNMNEPLFQPFPSEIYFQNFVPRNTYHLPLTLRNKDSFSRNIRMTQEDCPYFRVCSPAYMGCKAGPGISMTFDIYFLPDEYKDYEHELTFITDREMFVVPIHAIGARAFLDFPDSIHFETSPTKHPVSKTLLVRNIGNTVANFTLKMEISEKASFTVHPEVGSLKVDETAQVTIQFYPLQTGNHHNRLIIHYETGEKLQVQLFGSAQDVNIQLNKKSITLDNTFISTLTKHSVTIHNYADIRSYFRWTQFATQDEEDQQKILFKMKIQCDEQREILSDCSSQSTEQFSVKSRDIQNKQQEVSNRSMLFQDDVVRFDPVEGEVWPKTSVDVNIIFEPNQALHCERVAFCDVTGRQSRLPLCIIGEGIGPKLDFSFEDLDMGNIFMGLTNVYELVIWNRGAIDATYNILPNFTDFGRCFEFDPCDGRIKAGDYQAIRVSFTSKQLGTIHESFRFEVDGTVKNKEILFKGAVIAPSFSFSKPKLDFGDVSYGFPSTCTFSLLNTSLVTISFKLRIPSDGSIPSIHAMGQTPQGQTPQASSAYTFPLRGLRLPKEFDICPCEGTIEPHSWTEVKVTLTSNTLKTYQEMLVVDLHKVGYQFKGLPLIARCIVPQVELLTPGLDYGRCCLRYPFIRHVQLANHTNLPATYIILPQDTKSRIKDSPPTIKYSSPEPRKVIAPHSVQEVPVELIVDSVGDQSTSCFIAIFGSENPKMEVELKCNGEGPVVHVMPYRLSWGLIPVLTSLPMTLELCNESLIPASYTTSFSSRNPPFTVTPENGTIPPDSTSTLTVAAYLDDFLSFQSTLMIHFMDSNSRRVFLEATGEGNLIISDPPLLPHMNIGPIFCNYKMVRKFQLTNKSRRQHLLIWHTEGYSWSQKKQSLTKKFKYKKMMKPVADGAKPVFKFHPARFNLKPGQSIEFTIEASSDEEKSVSETLLCDGIVGSKGTKELLMKVQISATFIRPVLIFSDEQISFYVEKRPDDKLEIMEKSLQITNVSPLPLHITMVTHYPFSLYSTEGDVISDKIELYLVNNEKHDLTVRFDPGYKSDPLSRSIKDHITFTYEEHSHKDKVSLKGEVQFPNLKFDKLGVDFGCILNDTEVCRYLNMENVSPLQVRYRWSFLANFPYCNIRRIIRPRMPGGLKRNELQDELAKRKKQQEKMHEQVEMCMEESEAMQTPYEELVFDEYTCAPSISIEKFKGLLDWTGAKLVEPTKEKTPEKSLEVVEVLFEGQPMTEVEEVAAESSPTEELASASPLEDKNGEEMGETSLTEETNIKRKVLEINKDSDGKRKVSQFCKTSDAKRKTPEVHKAFDDRRNVSEAKKAHDDKNKTPDSKKSDDTSKTPESKKSDEDRSKTPEAKKSDDRSKTPESKKSDDRSKTPEAKKSDDRSKTPESKKSPAEDPPAPEEHYGSPSPPLSPYNHLEPVENVLREMAEALGQVTPEDSGNVLTKNNLMLSLEEDQALNSNPVLSDLMDKYCSTDLLSGVEQVFDIMPLFGALNPGEKQQVTFTFFGHTNITGEVRAVCEVEGGPEYDIVLMGDASLVEYHFESSQLDFGKQLYSAVGVKELTLVNSGRVPFKYQGLGMDSSSAKHPKAGKIYMVPHSGVIEPFSELKLQVRYKPGLPGLFRNKFFVQVAHFQPDVIHIFGEGVFPCICLDLPRCLIKESQYQAFAVLLTDACRNLMPNKSEISLQEFGSHYLIYARKSSVVCDGGGSGGGGSSVHSKESGSGGGQVSSVSRFPAYSKKYLCKECSSFPSREVIELEVDRLAVRNFLLDCGTEEMEVVNIESSREPSPCWECQSDAGPSQLQSEQASSTLVNVNPAPPVDTSKRRKKTKKPKPCLPEYLLNFGFVVPGIRRCHTVRVTNPGCSPVSFMVRRPMDLLTKGFIVGIDKVCHLPGAHENEAVDFDVIFDPRSARLPQGPVEVRVPFEVKFGPMVELVLRADVTVPGMRLSLDQLDMGTIKCGECSVAILQLHNNKQVACHWTVLYPTLSTQGFNKSQNQAGSALSLRRKNKLWKKGLMPFELVPASGLLLPNQRTNIQVIFTPTQEKVYDECLQLCVAQNDDHLSLRCTGQGLEPRLEFSQVLLEFPPTLPYSEGVYETVTITNPCSFPVEMYSLDLDTQYQEEEKVLRTINGYNDRNVLLLPPRSAGDKLPAELIRYYEECEKREWKKAKQESFCSNVTAVSTEGMENEGNVKSDSADNMQVRVAVALVEDQKKPGEGGESGITVPMIEEGLNSAPLTPPFKDLQDLPDTPLDPSVTEPVQESLGLAGDQPEVDNNPVWQCLAAYMGIDLKNLGKIPPHNSGIAIIVHGAPYSGKSFMARMLAKYYNHAAVLTIDGVVFEAITNPTSAHALEARELCEAAARTRAEEEHQISDCSTARLAEDSMRSGPESKASTAFKIKSMPKPADKQPSVQVGESRPMSQQLSISSIAGADHGLASCVLPEALLVSLLEDRMQMDDCRYGVVFDGLESLYAANIFAAANIILRAFNNRRFIFFCTLRMDYATYQEVERVKDHFKEKKAQQKEDMQRQKIEEMEEDQYDALSQAEKDNVDKTRLMFKKMRMKKEQEQREKREREREEEERRKEEELKNSKRKGKTLKRKSELSSHAMLSEHLATGKTPETASRLYNDDDSKNSELGNVQTAVKFSKGKKKKGEEFKNEDSLLAFDDHKDPVKEAEVLLIKRFKDTEFWHKDLCILLDHWDRVALQVRRPQGYIDHMDEEPVRRGKAKGEKGDKQAVSGISPKLVCPLDDLLEEMEDEEVDSGRVPHIIIDCSDHSDVRIQKIFDCGLLTSTDEVFGAGVLPSVEEVLEGMGQWSDGPPIPPPVTLAVVHFPNKRKPHVTPTPSNFVFVENLPDTLPLVKVQLLEKLLTESDEDKPSDSQKVESQSLTPSVAKHRSTSKSRSGMLDQASKTSKDIKSKKGTGREEVSPSRTIPVLETSHTPSIMPAHTRLTSFRWVIPAHGELKLRLFFSSEDMGLFQQVFNFELVGVRCQYQLVCKCSCDFPTISKDPQVLFLSRKKTLKENEIVFKKFILSTNVYEFGPLLVGRNMTLNKGEDWNTDKFQLHNPGTQNADITVRFLNDNRVFSVDTRKLTVPAGDTVTFQVHALPLSPGRWTDTITFCIHKNPEPVVIQLACYGVRPEITLDKKILAFDKVLVHRMDTKTITLYNPTRLPVAWRLVGWEMLGDDFMVSASEGIVEPLANYTLEAFFRALKPIVHSKRMIRMEVSDIDDALGVVQIEHIQVSAEAYDVAIDIIFSKGVMGCLDFGTVRVNEDVLQPITLRNKGRYEISCLFLADKFESELASLFSFVPSKLTLTAVDKPVQVMVVGKCPISVDVKELPLFKCLLYEGPGKGEKAEDEKRRETIATIPIKLTIKAVYSAYCIVPAADMNFGSTLIQTRKTRTMIIQNCGDMDFRFTIRKKSDSIQPVPGLALSAKKHEKGAKKIGLFSGGSGLSPQRKESGSFCNKMEISAGSAGKLAMGPFYLYPAIAVVKANSSYNVTVECSPDKEGPSVEELTISISESSPMDQPPEGLPYKLLCEGCFSSINVDNFRSIFEEQHIFENLLNLPPEIESVGVFGEDERRFLFSSVIVGRKAKARFKITNTSKVPSELVFSIRPLPHKTMNKMPIQPQPEIFEVDPQKATIMGNSSIFVTVSFCPPSMQVFNMVFEAVIDGFTRSKPLTFEVSGEGTLPRVVVTRPLVLGMNGLPLMVFGRILVGKAQILPLSLQNTGTLPCKVNIEMSDPERVFTLCPADYEDPTSICATFKKRENASAVLSVGETADFDVYYTPVTHKRSRAMIKVSVVDNPFEDNQVFTVGEGHRDTVTVDNIVGCRSISCSAQPIRTSSNSMLSRQVSTENACDLLDQEPGVDCHLLSFGDCVVGVPYTITFTLNNHSVCDSVRFTWPQHPLLVFSPQVGHLHPKCSKDIQVTFLSSSPVTLSREVLTGNLVSLDIDAPVCERPDWDDRVKVVKWVNLEDKTDNTSNRQVKKKVVEAMSEPCHSELVETVRELELTVSCLADFVRCECSTSTVHFKPTFLFETRNAHFTLQNSGQVVMTYQWTLRIEATPAPAKRSFKVLGVKDRVKFETKCLKEGGGGGGGGGRESPSYIPIAVEPEEGTIDPGQAASFTVSFSPMDVGHHLAYLSCKVPHLAEDCVLPKVEVLGEGLLPTCHFDLTLSDYLTSGRRNSSLVTPGRTSPNTPLDPNTRVIECHSVGISPTTVVDFKVINPTSSTYDFQWVCEDVEDQSSLPTPEHPFKVLFCKGTINSGTRVNMMFEFRPTQLGTVESLWKFHIPSQMLTCPFLLVGHARQAQVFMDTASVDFQPLLISHQATERVHLINKENVALAFQFLENTCHTEGFASVINVKPMTGKVPPNSSMAVDLTFKPTQEKAVKFSVQCKVQHVINPLTLTVKAEGYAMHYTLYTRDDNNKKELMTVRGYNTINFGEVQMREEAQRPLFINNTSAKYNLDFNWHFEVDNAPLSPTLTKKPPYEKSTSPVFRVEPTDGSIASGETKKCLLIFCPPNCQPLKNCRLHLKTSNGPSLHISVMGRGVLPGLHLSFQSHNFGYAFIEECMDPPPSRTLTLTNTHQKTISISCLYNNTAHLHHDFEDKALEPGESCTVTFTFTPQEEGEHRDQINFRVNGLTQHSVIFTGTGCHINVGVAESSLKEVRLKQCYPGDIVKRQVPIVNWSPAPLSMHLQLSCSSEFLAPNQLFFAPQGPLILSPNGGKLVVSILFHPRERVPEFSQQVSVVSGPLVLPMFTVVGVCLGMDIALSTRHIPFGTVMLNSSATRKLTMFNYGDLNTRFLWDAASFTPDFSISPVDGYVTPGSEVRFTVTFHPKAVSPDISYEKMYCFVDGGNQLTLELKLSGSCTDVQPLKDVVTFTTQVRGKDVKSIPITNNSLQHWTLSPVVEGEQWSGPPILSVEPGHTKTYDIMYHPMTMTTDTKHTGTVFFAFPDGLAQLHMLSGTALPPKLSGRVTQDTPAKTDYTQILPVHNWLNVPMRFAAKVDVISEKSGKSDPGLKISSLDYIEVPAMTKTLYKLQVYACREGPLHLKVTFTHEPSGEYQWYEVFLRFTRPGSMGIIELSTSARQGIKHKIAIENPMPQQASFITTCTMPDIIVPASPTSLPPNSKGTVTIEFLPLKSGEGTGKLELFNAEVGHIVYDVLVHSTPASPEKTVHFSTTPLGHTQIQTVHFPCLVKQRLEFVCKVDNSDFLVDKSLVVNPAPAQPGPGYSPMDVGLEVTFEPSVMGEQRTTLLVTSPIGGDYEIPLVGSCCAPTPQGPFVVKVGAPTAIIFRNVFTCAIKLNQKVEPAVFRVQSPKENVRAKKEQRVNVLFDGRDCREDVNGRLVLSCLSPLDGVTEIQWVYYLKGVVTRQDFQRYSSYQN